MHPAVIELLEALQGESIPDDAADRFLRAVGRDITPFQHLTVAMVALRDKGYVRLAYAISQLIERGLAPIVAEELADAHAGRAQKDRAEPIKQPRQTPAIGLRKPS